MSGFNACECFSALNIVLPDDHNDAKARLNNSILVTSENDKQHVYLVISRQAVKPVSVAHAEKKAWRLCFHTKALMLAFAGAGPMLEFDKYVVMIKQEMFYYEIRVPEVLGKKEIQEWFQGKDFHPSDIVSASVTKLEGLYSFNIRMIMRKHIIDEMRIKCGNGAARCWVTAKTSN